MSLGPSNSGDGVQKSHFTRVDPLLDTFGPLKRPEPKAMTAEDKAALSKVLAERADRNRPEVAALFVESMGVYFGIPGVDPWTEDRDARKYAGPWPVVAHPPCNVWCQLAHINQKRYGHKVGEDGGCFAAALDCVRTFGGVLEHPARSYAWPAFNLPVPRGRWLRELHDVGWVAEVSQSAYGHPARKLTWLYYVGDAPPPELDWSQREPTAQVSFCKNHGNSPLPRLSKKAAKATPPAFRDALLSMARGARGLRHAA